MMIHAARWLFQIFDMDLAGSGHELQLAGSTAASERFCSLTWGSLGLSDGSLPVSLLSTLTLLEGHRQCRMALTSCSCASVYGSVISACLSIRAAELSSCLCTAPPVLASALLGTGSHHKWAAALRRHAAWVTDHT